MPTGALDAEGDDVHEVEDDRVFGYGPVVCPQALIVGPPVLESWLPLGWLHPARHGLLGSDALRLDLPLGVCHETTLGFHDVGVRLPADSAFGDHAQELLGHLSSPRCPDFFAHDRHAFEGKGGGRTTMLPVCMCDLEVRVAQG